MADSTATPPPEITAKARQPPHWLPHSISRLDRTIAHTNRLLSTTAGLDTTLLTLNYTLVLLHAQLTSLSKARLSRAAHTLASKATTSSTRTAALDPNNPALLLATIGLTPPPSTTTHHLLRSARALHALAALLADVRVFLRLWGLLGIWAWAAETWRRPPADAVLRGVAWAQVGVNVGYQVLENGAYLGSKGVVGMGAGRVARWELWSARFWMAHVALDLGRLGRGWWLLRGGEEKEGKVVRRREVERWWREAWVDAAYAPLTVHWSLEGGCVSEAWVGFLGMVAGVVGLREVWAETA